MKIKFQHLASICLVSVFVFLAFASFGPDASTNTSVAIKDCEEQPPISGTFNIFVSLKLPAPDGIPKGVQAAGKIFIVRQKVNDNEACTYTSTSQTIDFTTSHNGEYSYTGMSYMHDNSQDLVRVEILVNGSVFEFHGPHKEVRVHHYSIPDINFIKTLPGLLTSE